MEIDEDLETLFFDWDARVGRGGAMTNFLDNPRISENLLAQITEVEPFRTRAIEDAKLYWSLPSFALGFGMELIFSGSIEIVPFQNWRETIQNLTARKEFSERMDGTNCVRYDVKLERVGRENGAWKIIEVFSQIERENMQNIYQAVKKLYANKEKNI